MAKAGLVYVGTDDGIVTLSDPGGIGRWRQVGHTLQGETIRSIAAQNPLTLLVTGAGLGVQRTNDGGMSWHQVSQAKYFALATHSSNPSAVYAATIKGTIERSDDGGLTWKTCPSPTPVIALLTAPGIDTETQPYTIVAALVNEVWVSHKAGDAWQQYGKPFPAAIQGLAASAEQPGHLFAIAGGQIYQADALHTWDRVTPPPDGWYCAGAPAVLAGKQPVVLVALTNVVDHTALMRSEDGGETWQLARLPEPSESRMGTITSIVPADYHRDVAWVGTDSGQLWYTDDRGRTFQRIAEGFAPIYSLAPSRLM